MFGWYDEGFFAFSNAIVHEIDGKQELQYVTDLGLVEHNKNITISRLSLKFTHPSAGIAIATIWIALSSTGNPKRDVLSISKSGPH